MNVTDIHSHLLPGVDDGSKTVEEALGALCESAYQGVTRQCFTPHYYSEESIADFLARREAAFDSLLEAAAKGAVPAFEGEAYPAGIKTKADGSGFDVYVKNTLTHCEMKIYLGCEAAWHPGLVHDDRLTDLCYNGTRYLLLELPFDGWSDKVIDDVEFMIRTLGIVPVIAHMERYDDVPRKLKRKLRELPVIIQSNCGYLLGPETRRSAVSDIENGYVHILGSDSHGMRRRRPNSGKAAALMQEMNGEEYLEMFEENADRILGI